MTPKGSQGGPPNEQNGHGRLYVRPGDGARQFLELGRLGAGGELEGLGAGDVVTYHPACVRLDTRSAPFGRGFACRVSGEPYRLADGSWVVRVEGLDQEYAAWTGRQSSWAIVSVLAITRVAQVVRP